MRELHDWMPVILPTDLYGDWLDSNLQEPDALKPMLVLDSESEITFRPVSTFVDNPRNDSPACIEPVQPSA